MRTDPSSGFEQMFELPDGDEPEDGDGAHRAKRDREPTPSEMAKTWDSPAVVAEFTLPAQVAPLNVHPLTKDQLTYGIDAYDTLGR